MICKFVQSKKKITVIIALIIVNKYFLPEEFNLDLETTDFPSTVSIVEDTPDDDERDDAIGWETKLFVFSVFEGCNTPCWAGLGSY